MNTSQLQLNISQLNQLPCFARIDTITPLNSGLSCTSYKIQTPEGCFFAKYSANTHNNAMAAINTNSAAATAGFAAKVIYSDQHWFVSEYINGIELKNMALTLNEKINIAVKLMGQCHQLTFDKSTLNKLNSVKLIQAQLSSNLFTQQQGEIIENFCRNFSIDTSTNVFVTCHGDLNFSNILSTNTSQNISYLVDFDCVCLAPIEYDIAMLLAVNSIEQKALPAVIASYQKQHHLIINNKMVMRYLSFCYVINGLWYMVQAEQQNNPLLKSYAHQQFRLFDQLGIIDTSLYRLMR